MPRPETPAEAPPEDTGLILPTNETQGEINDEESKGEAQADASHNDDEESEGEGQADAPLSGKQRDGEQPHLAQVPGNEKLPTNDDSSDEESTRSEYVARRRYRMRKRDAPYYRDARPYTPRRKNC